MATALLRALGTRRAMVVVIAASLAIAAVSIAVGFLTDDHAFRVMLRSTSGRAPAAYDLFRFVPGDPADNQLRIRYGFLPWWSAPDLRIHFVRPLTAVAFAADVELFGDSPLGYHLHSLAWLLVLLVAAAVWFRRLLPPAAATIALAVFGLAEAHVEAYAWLSARHAVIAGALAAIALAARWSRHRWLAPLLFAVALTASEASLAAAPLWVALELAARKPRRSRLLACIAPVALSLAYLAVYAALGAGTRGSGGYHNPLADPIGFVGIAALRVPILLGDAALGIPAELAHVVAEAWMALVGLAAVGVVALGWWLTRLRRAAAGGEEAVGGGTGGTSDHANGNAPAAATSDRRTIAWLAAGGVAATILGAAGYPSGRVLVIPDLAFAAVIGLILHAAFSARWPGRLVAALLAVAHLVLAPLASLHTIDKLARRAHATDAVAERIAQLAPPSGRVFLIAADPMVYVYPRGILGDVSPGAVHCWSTWSAAHAGHRITRLSAKRLAIEPIERPLLDGSFDELYRAPDQPFAAGDQVEQCGATIRVAAVRDGRPSRLEVELRRSLDDPEVAILVWKDRHLERLVPPARGETIELPWSPGPSGL